MSAQSQDAWRAHLDRIMREEPPRDEFPWLVVGLFLGVLAGLWYLARWLL